MQKLSDEVGEKRTLLIMCGAFRVKNLADFPNLTVKKIPKAVLNRCKWGHDDYSLEIKNLPVKPPMETEMPEISANGSKICIGAERGRKAVGQEEMFKAKEDSEDAK